MARSALRRWPALLLALAVAVLLFGCGADSAESGVRPADPVAAQGFDIYSQDCQRCHKLDPDDDRRGPTFAQLAVTAQNRVPGMDAADYLRTSIIDPSAYVVDGYPNNMPDDYGEVYSDVELDALVAYMLTLE